MFLRYSFKVIITKKIKFLNCYDVPCIVSPFGNVDTCPPTTTNLMMLDTTKLIPFKKNKILESGPVIQI